MSENFFQSKFFLSAFEKLHQLANNLPKIPEQIPTSKILSIYHRYGKIIDSLNQRAPKGQKMAMRAKLAKTLSMEPRAISHLQQFFQRFSEGVPKIDRLDQLKWSHIRAVLPLEDQKVALWYLEQAAQDVTPVRLLENSIKQNHYQLIQQAGKDHPNGLLDQPFDPRYHWLAYVEKIIDPDTIKLVVEKGFYEMLRMTARLRGINAYELHGPHHAIAVKGTKFVQKAIGTCQFIMITTYQTDSFGRYVVDVRYHPMWEDPVKVFQEGFFLNQQLLDAGLAKLAAY